MAYRVKKGDNWMSLETANPGIQAANPGIRNPKAGMSLSIPYNPLPGQSPQLNYGNPYANVTFGAPPTMLPNNNGAVGIRSVDRSRGGYGIQPSQPVTINPSIGSNRGGYGMQQTYNGMGNSLLKTGFDQSMLNGDELDLFLAAQAYNIANPGGGSGGGTDGGQRQKTYVQQWAEGGMTGKQMRAMYGRGWKDRMRIKTPKGKTYAARMRKAASKGSGNPWYSTPTTDGVSWRM